MDADFSVVPGRKPLCILLTGAAGFIGYHVAERLLARGEKVLGLDSLNDYYDPALRVKRGFAVWMRSACGRKSKEWPAGFWSSGM